MWWRQWRCQDVLLTRKVLTELHRGPERLPASSDDADAHLGAGLKIWEFSRALRLCAGCRPRAEVARSAAGGEGAARSR